MQAIRSQSTKKTFFFFHFARTALRQEKKKAPSSYCTVFLFFFFFLTSLPEYFSAVSLPMTGAHSKKRRGQPEVRCPLPSRLSSPSHVGSGFLQPPVNKNINSTDNVRAISVRLFLSHQYATRVRGQQLWLETRSVQVYVCDPVTRTTAFPAVPEQKGLRRARFSTACFFFSLCTFFLPFSPSFRKMTRSGEGGGKAGNKRR